MHADERGVKVFGWVVWKHATLIMEYKDVVLETKEMMLWLDMRRFPWDVGEMFAIRYPTKFTVCVELESVVRTMDVASLIDPSL
jgi:hypothetical protein